MPDPFKNARAYYDPSFPSSGDGFSIAALKNALQGLAFMDMLPLQPRAHSPADTKIMVRGRDAAGFYNQIYPGNADSRLAFVSGDSPAIAAPASLPRIDIVYITPSGDIKVRTGTESASPGLPSLSPSGDSRIPICALYCKPGQTKIVNFEDKDSNTGDAYIYQDLRPWLRPASTGATFSTVTPASPTGDGQATPGTATTSARSDHTHPGVRGVRIPGGALLQGEIEIAGANIVQAGNRITLGSKLVKMAYAFDGAFASGSTATPIDNTPPLSTEGDQYGTINYTPLDASNIIVGIFTGNWSGSATADSVQAIYKDAETTPRASSIFDIVANSEIVSVTPFVLNPAGQTSQITFKARLGGNGGGTNYYNGRLGSGLFGGTITSGWIIMEFAP